jgi:hypothetical protein
MTRPSDPPRWLESSDCDLSAAQRRALTAYAERGPSEAQRDALFRRLAQAEGGPVRHDALRTRWLWPAVASAVLLAAAAYLLSSWPRSAERSADPAKVSAPAGSGLVRPAPSAPSSALRVRTTAPEPRDVVSADAGVVREVGARRRSKGSASRVRPAPSADPSEELALLVPARRLLAVDAARALVLADQHAARFPLGAFAEERDFLRIEALLRLGRRAEAEGRAKAFRGAHAGSAYLERIALLLATP